LAAEGDRILVAAGKPPDRDVADRKALIEHQLTADQPRTGDEVVDVLVHRRRASAPGVAASAVRYAPDVTRVPSLRASDSDREQVAERLRHASAEGRISTEELEERVGALSAARTYGDLDALVGDLPVGRAVSRPRARVPLWVGAASAVSLMVVVGMVAAVVRHFAEAAGELRGPLAHAGHVMIAAAASTAFVFAVVVICATLFWRFLRSRHARHD
jgi:hypothetical protein